MKKRIVISVLVLAIALLPLGAPPVTAELPRDSDAVRTNGSFETGSFAMWWMHWTYISSLHPWLVVKQGQEPEGIHFDVTPSHGEHACLIAISSPQAWMFGWFGSPLWLPESSSIHLPPGIAFEYRIVSQPSDNTELRGMDSNVTLYVSVTPYAAAGDSSMSPLDTPAEVRQILYSGPITAGMDTGNVTAALDLSTLAGQDVMLRIEWDSTNDTDQDVWLQIDNVRLFPYPTPQRADVSVIVYGGWDGLPVDAWVGGTAQPRMATAINAFGEQQAMWSVWPDPGESWQVSTQPVLPAGLDPDEWEYRLIRTACPTMGWSNESPGSGVLQILPGQQYIVTYQLFHKG
ncbi:MAG: hypothetical protein ACYC5M_06915 [Anaerolineae bacterium]